MMRGITQKLLIGIVTGMCLLSSKIDAADKWTNIPQDTSSFGSVYYNVNCCYDSAIGRIYATWSEQEPPYSIRSAYYNGSSWTNIPQDTSSFGSVYDAVHCCYDSTSERIYATWRDNETPYSLRSAYYDGSSWTNIPQDTSSFGSVYDDVYCCYDSARGRIYATWRDYDLPYSLRSAYYDGSSWINIPQDTSSFGSVGVNVSCCYDSASRRIYATWSDKQSYFNFIRSAYYDGSTWTNIPQDTSSFGEVWNDVICCYDSASERIYATWSDQERPYSIRSAYYDGSSWNNISQDTSSFGEVLNDVICCYDSTIGRIYATWTDLDSPYSLRSAYYDGSTWTNIPQDTSSFGLVYSDVICCYDSTRGRIYATWAELDSPYSLRSAYYITTPDINPLSLTGIQKCNDFAVVSEQFNILSWKSLSPQAFSYRLERNGVTAGPPLGPETTSYEDHNRISKIADTYRLTALDALGNPIATDTITIKGE